MLARAFLSKKARFEVMQARTSGGKLSRRLHEVPGVEWRSGIIRLEKWTERRGITLN